MAALDSLKRAPKWAWWTAGGLAMGGAGIKLWRDRAKPEDGAADPASVTGDAVSVGGGAPGAGVIVPPVIIPASDDGSSQVLGFLSTIVGSTTDAWQAVLASALGVDDAYAAVYMPIADMLPGLITQSANGGGPPPPGNVIVNIPQPTPAPAPAPHAPTPAPHAPAPHPAPHPACPAAFPNKSDRGCYKNCGHDECKNHKIRRDHGHCYSNGQRIHISYENTNQHC